MKAVIMAAGKGVRLKPLTKVFPKPLILIGFKNGVAYTIIEKIIEQIKKAGIKEIAIVVNYKKEAIKEYLEDGSSLGVEIKYYEQETLDGNAGAIWRCKDFLDDDLLFTDADNFVSDDNVFLNLRNLFEKSNAKAVVGVKKVNNPEKYAIFKTDENGKLIDIFEKPKDESWGNLAKTGFGIISKELAENIKEISKNQEGEYTTTQIFKYMLDNNLSIEPFVLESEYADLGTWDEYHRILKENL